MWIHRCLKSTATLCPPVPKTVVWCKLGSKGALGLFTAVEGLVHLPELQDALCGTGTAKGLETDNWEGCRAAGAVCSLVRSCGGKRKEKRGQKSSNGRISAFSVQGVVVGREQ